MLLPRKVGSDKIEGEVKQTEGYFAEEDRSKQPSVFSVVRAIVNIFESHEDSHLGLYGAFGYDLAFQFENIKLHKDRDPSQRDLVMYIPDNMLIINHQMQSAWRMKYDFAFAAGGKILSTKGMHDKGPEVHFKPRIVLVQEVRCRTATPQVSLLWRVAVVPNAMCQVAS